MRIFTKIFLFLLCGYYTLHSQQDEITGGKELEFVEEAPSENSFTEYMNGETTGTHSVLQKYISLEMKDANLIDVINAISTKYNVNFVYEPRLIDIKNISISVEDKPLFELLGELLNIRNISYYEFELGKIALAKSYLVDEKTATIKGTIKDEKGEKLIGSNIVIKQLGIGSTCDNRGFYQIKNIKPGEYTIEVTFVGYEKFLRAVRVAAGEVLELNIVLKSTSFQIGGIEVIGQRDLIPNDVSTKTTITSGEIEHYQASSIGDVLDLVPGIQKTENPGLGKTSQFTIRSDDADQQSKFGTSVIIDGTPLSNNANLQFEKLTGSKFGTSTMASGIDLRTIPADNIESIEVITGLPSVRYGDVTSGIINVQTKIGVQPHRLKLKNNPDTREANLGGGFLVGEDGFSYNFNIAQSERDIRKTGDEYTRLTGQVVYSGNYFQNTLSFNNKLLIQKILDEEEPKGDMQKTKNYNRGFSLSFSSWGKYRPDDGVSTWDYNFFVTMRKENSMRSKLVTDYLITPSLDTISSYIGKVETKGIEWTVGTRIEYNKVFYTGDIIHKFMIGTDPQYNANTGDGVIFDTLYSYYGVGSGNRPYKFDDIPGQFLINFYMEDKITGHFIFDYNIMLGFRYELYRPYKFNLKGLWGNGDLIQSHNGSYFNPRFNMMIYFAEYSQFRLSAGTSSKSPPMSTLFSRDYVKNSWRNPEDGKAYYFRINSWYPDLKGYRETIFETSYDHKFFNRIGTTISAYYKIRKNEYESWPSPLFAYNSTKTIAYLVDANYGYLLNTGQTITKGLEFSIRTSKIEPLNMDFQVTGSYNFYKNPSTKISYGTPDKTLGQYENYHVPGVLVDTLVGWTYPSSGSWQDRMQMNYYIKYTLPKLGLWITLRAEHVLFQRSQSFQLTPVDFNVMNEGSKEKRIWDEAIHREVQKWLFNLSLSKSLFKGAEVSFYVNNFLDDPAIWRHYINYNTISDSKRNPDLFYGIEFSFIADYFFSKGGSDE